MVRTTIAACALIASTNAFAVARITSEGMSCDQVRQAIESGGAVIIQHRSASGNLLYDRYVKNGQFCASEQVTMYASVPSSDTASCPVLRCEQFDFKPGGN